MTPRCDHCRFWHQYSTRRAYGDCRYAPPSITESIGGQWPESRAEDWCGKWQPNIPRTVPIDDE